ncbi:hypothetical protein Slin15195_G109560 [Septoria linicola]|uniref:Xylanolytic transcriptional activator regulatory domain-containing protein n=1 Tax=Septoria linicola TaxID=215465 RepID=A0A9Q9AXA7_9PEZI|nr:hypothetical protein Slin14017_G107910 [Septoria linicola]USW57637.1 hypothetical protein Slin15195_G109560 [Septoria linicola]
MSEPPVRRQHKRPRPQSSCACQKHGCAYQCRYDGLQPSSSTATTFTSSDSRGEQLTDETAVRNVEEAIQAAPSGSLRERAEASRLEILALIQAGKLNARTKSKYATHDWIHTSQGGPLRGRTHTTGILKHFDPLMIYVGRTSLSGHSIEDDGKDMRRKHRQTNFQDHTISSLYADIGPLNTSMELILRYFETWHTVFPLVDRTTFDQAYGDMLADPTNTSVCFVIGTLLMMALANATYPPEEARLPDDKVLRWLDAASGLLLPIVESGEIHGKAVRGAALLSLAELVLSFDSTAGYIKSGAVVRMTMTLSLHRSERHEESACRALVHQLSLWNTIVELDQHACLAAGMPPSAPEPALPDDDGTEATNEGDLVRLLDQTNLHALLERSLPIRHRILTVLNGATHLMFEQVVELSTALTKAFAPVSTRQDIPRALKTFQYEYVFFVYRRYMSALHRLFANMDGEPATYISRGMAVRLARRHMRTVCSVWQASNDVGYFAPLLASNGMMFRSETCHAIFTIAHELYREAEEIQTVLLSVEDGRSGLIETFKAFFGFLEAKVAKHEVPEKAFLIPAMVYAHNRISATHPVNSGEYCRAMAEAGAEAAKFIGCA